MKQKYFTRWNFSNFIVGIINILGIIILWVVFNIFIFFNILSAVLYCFIVNLLWFNMVEARSKTPYLKHQLNCVLQCKVKIIRSSRSWQITGQWLYHLHLPSTSVWQWLIDARGVLHRKARWEFTSARSSYSV